MNCFGWHDTAIEMALEQVWDEVLAEIRLMQAQADWVLEPTGEREMDPLENVWEGYEPGVRPRRYHGGECPGKSGSFPGQGLRNR